MKYFKMIENNVIIGVITSNNFMRYMPITDCFIRANEETGEYVSFNNKFYRSTWMRPITFTVNYTEIFIIEISEDEYNIYNEAFAMNETITIENEEIEEEEEEVEEESYEDPIDLASIHFIRSSKINEMSYLCRKVIEAGFDLELRGEIHHFSLSTQDQLNLISLSAMALTQELIPYHADGEACIFYTAAEINSIVTAATQFKIYHTTYYNALKTYINALDTIEDIAAITYGVTIPEEYKSDVLKALEE